MKVYYIYFFVFTWIKTKADDPVVNIKFGNIRGIYSKSSNEQIMSVFRGIPYAKPPTGPLRFQPPEKFNEPWKGDLDASKSGSDCIQYNKGTKKIIGQENCLFLNIYVPGAMTKMNLDIKKAVLVHIHGGRYTRGSGSVTNYGPRRILDHDVILVTINYRLNVLGFLSSSENALPGNYGLLDQLEALTWIQENIEAFGGDPKRVTIMGDGAGGASVALHLLSKFAVGLFSGAIILSGNPFSPWAFDYSPKQIFRDYSTNVGCVKPTPKEVVDCLKELPIEKLLRPLPKFATQFLSPFRPVLDGQYLTDHPLQMYRNGQIANQVPIMLGINQLEGTYYFGKLFETTTPTFSQRIASKVTKFILNYDDDVIINEAKTLITNRYFSPNSVAKPELVKPRIVKLISDFVSVPHYFNAFMYSKFGLDPYVFVYEYVTDHSIVKKIKSLETNANPAPTFGDDLYFLFDSKSLFPDDYAKNNDETERKFLKLFINFVNFRNPTPRNAVRERWRPWYPSKNGNIRLYHLNKRMKSSIMRVSPELTDFWMHKIPKCFGISY